MAALPTRALAALLCLAAATAQQIAVANNWSPAASNAGLKPQRLQAYGHTHYYQLAEKPVAGTVVLIHGCGPNARSFFPYDPVNCVECLGYPEYLAQTKQALARGYHVLALNANSGGCWSSSTRNGFVDDRPDVAATAVQFLKDHAATKLPVYYMGYSSGGTMLLKLPAFLQSEAKWAAKGLRMDGIVAVDAAPSGGFNAEGSDGKLKRGLKYPPVAYVVMERGKARQRAPEQIAFLKRNGVAADMTASLPRKVGPSYFSDRIPTVTRPQSEELWGALSALGGFDAQGYLLPVDLNLVFTTLPWLADGLIRDAVFQEVQIAVGNHENMGEFTAASLAWLEKKGKTKLATLVKQLVSSRPAELTIDRRQAGAFGIAEFEATPAPAPEPAYVLL